MNTEDRFINIETKVAYQEDLINELNKVVCKQQDQIDSLIHASEKFKKRLEIIEVSKDELIDPPINERPPHY